MLNLVGAMYSCCFFCGVLFCYMVRRQAWPGQAPKGLPWQAAATCSGAAASPLAGAGCIAADLLYAWATAVWGTYRVRWNSRRSWGYLGQQRALGLHCCCQPVLLLRH